MTSTTRCHKPAHIAQPASPARLGTRISDLLRTLGGFAVAFALVAIGLLGTMSANADAGEPATVPGVTAQLPVSDPEAGHVLAGRTGGTASILAPRRQQQVPPIRHRADAAPTVAPLIAGLRSADQQEPTAGR